MKNKLYKIFLPCLILLSACQQTDIIETEGEGTKFNFTVEASLGDIVENAATRADLANVVRLQWKAGDRISVCNLTDGTVLRGYLEATRSGSTTSFTGTLQGNIKGGDKLGFIYPAEESWMGTDDPSDPGYNYYYLSNNKADDNYLRFMATAEYTVDAKTFAGNTAYQAEAKFQFLSSYLTLNISGLPASTEISYVEIPGMGSECSIVDWAGEFSHEVTNGVIRISDVGATTAQGYVDVRATCAGADAIYTDISKTELARRSVKVVTADGAVYKSSISGQAFNLSTHYNVNVSDFKLSGGIYNGHEYVDLGLPSGTMWAVENVSSEGGNYFAFGEGNGHGSEGAVMTFGNYLHANGSAMTRYGDYDTEKDPMVKYTTKLLSIGGTQFDAATSSWGDFWRIPTEEECLELAGLAKSTNNITREVTFNNSKSGQSITTPFKFWTSTPSKKGYATCMVMESGSQFALVPTEKQRLEEYAIRPVLSLISIPDYVIALPAEGGETEFDIRSLNQNVRLTVANEKNLPDWINNEDSIIDGGGMYLLVPANTEGCERIAKIVIEATWDSNPIFAGKKQTRTIYVYQATNGQSDTVTDPGWLQ